MNKRAMGAVIDRLCIAVVIAVVGTFTIGVLLLGTGLGHRILANDEPRPVVRPVMRPMPNLGWALWSYKGGGKWEAMGTYDSQEACEAAYQAADPDRRIQDLEKKFGRQLRFCDLSTLPHWDSGFLYYPKGK
jgi:hypothetical protein